MERFEFDTSKEGGPNANRKNHVTCHGAIELYPGLGNRFLNFCIDGPKGAARGRAFLDKATAQKLGVALLKWANFNVDVPLLVSQIEWLAGLVPWTEEQEGLLNLLGALRDAFE